MSKLFWCRLGLHDWEYVDYVTKREVEVEAEDWDMPSFYEGGSRYVFKRVCLVCGHVEDRIADYRKLLEKKKQRRNERRRRANWLLGGLEREIAKEENGDDGWPDGWPWYKQSCFGSFDKRCDMLVGPCACGASHQLGEFELRGGILWRYNSPVRDVDVRYGQGKKETP